MVSSFSAVQSLLRDLLGPRFEVRGEIGSGGFGQVFEVFDTQLQSIVAAKVLRPELLGQEGAAERFLREIHLLAELRHPNIIPILDVFRSDRLIAYLMPLVAGPTLRQRLESVGALPLDEAIRIVGEVGGALDFAHRKGVIHRDLKPENILLSDGHAVLADFGIARTLVGTDGSGLTETGVVVGSPRYMSPEQVSGQDRLDGRSDLYALAAIAYELIAGHPPIATSSGEGLLRQKLLTTPTSLQVVRAAVPAALDCAILRGLAATPADRQATAGEFVRECVEGMRELRGAAAPAPTGRAGAKPRPIPRAIAWGAGAVALAIAGLLIWNGTRRVDIAPTAALPQGYRAWFVIADVVTDPPDSSTAKAARSIIESQFEQSDVLGLLTADEVTHVLISAGVPKSSVLTPALARRVAFRAAAAGIIATSVQRTASGALLSLRVVAADRETVITSFRREIPPGQSVLSVLDAEVARVRKDLTPRAPALASAKNPLAIQAPHVMTTDDEAWRLADMSRAASDRGEIRESVALAWEAVCRDSTFLRGWQLLGVAYGNAGHRDSAAWAYETALRHRDQMSTDTRWFLESSLSGVKSDHTNRLRVSQRQAREHKGDGVEARFNVNLAGALCNVGRFDEAVRLGRDAMLQFSPGFRDVAAANLVGYWLAIGEADSARMVAESIGDDGWRMGALLDVACFQAEGPAIDRLAYPLLDNPSIEGPTRSSAHTALAARAANQGRVSEGWQRLGKAVLNAQEQGNAGQTHLAFWRQSLMALMYGGALSPKPVNPARNSSLDSQISSGLEALLEGRPDRARSIAAGLERRFASQPTMLEGAPSLLRGWAASLEGKPTEVIRECARVLEDRSPDSYLNIRRPAAEWLTARAFEQLQQPDSAAVHYRAALQRTGIGFYGLSTAYLAEFPARQRLAIAEARAGRMTEARAERDVLARMVDRPDAIAAAGLAEVDLVLGMSPRDESKRAAGEN